jgi:DNA-binding NtrC family response regulator
VAETGGKTNGMADKKIILAIDDSATQRAVYKAILGDQYDVRVCESAVKALDMLERINADLIITDLEMPEMTGFEFLREKGERTHIREIPLIVASGYKHISRATQYGVRDFIPKPVDPSDLKRQIKRILEKE